MQAAAEALPPAPRAPASANAFNPAISVVLNGSYAVSDDDPGLARVAGFALGEEAGLPDRGFSLGESEVAISANVDQAFFANLIVAIGGDDSIGVEEGYIQTTSLPWGFTAKAGRFFSGIGYLNEKHAHTWDFSDAPLPYRAMLENQYGDDGIEVRWLAPTDFFLEFGAEWFRGDAFPAGGADDNGAGTIAAFVHAGGDIDVSSSFLAGLSYLRAKALDRDIGRRRVHRVRRPCDREPRLQMGAERQPGRDEPSRERRVFLRPRRRHVQRRSRRSSTARGFTCKVFINSCRGGALGRAMRSCGATMRLWRSRAARWTISVIRRARRSALLEYDTSEFGRFRLQYTLDDADLASNDEFVVAYTVAIGAARRPQFLRNQIHA